MGRKYKRERGTNTERPASRFPNYWGRTEGNRTLTTPASSRPQPTRLPFLPNSLRIHSGPLKADLPSTAPHGGPGSGTPCLPRRQAHGLAPFPTWGARQATLGLPSLGLPRPVAVDPFLRLVAAPEEEQRGSAEAPSCRCHTDGGHYLGPLTGRTRVSSRPQQAGSPSPWTAWNPGTRCAPGGRPKPRHGVLPRSWLAWDLPLGANPGTRPSKPHPQSPLDARGPRGWGNWDSGKLEGWSCRYPPSATKCLYVPWSLATPLLGAPESNRTYTM